MHNTLNSIVKAYQDYLGDELISIVLFGSMARGEARKDSDYDLFIIAKNLPQDRFKRISFLHNPEIVAKEGLSIIGKEPQEFEAYLPSLYLDIALDGIILFDRDGYMASKIARIKELIKEAALKREKIDGELMWFFNRPVKPGKWELEWDGFREGS